MERSVEIRIANKTHDVTFHSPRSYCFSGYSSNPPCPRIPPGATESCQFTNSMLRFRGSVGLLVYEADTFTLAILFSNPFDYNLYSVEFAVEISMHKAHLKDLQNIYKRMYNDQPASTGNETMLHRVKLGACQEPVMVSAGQVKVMATMSNARKSIMRVIINGQEDYTA
ncbi:deep-sea actinoporin Cjtox I-like [Phalacrocorax carbo]|uniref:deep-sea actinoporin Cjtox I-like n=1 Tax=Phalacrocorax carbo TaxID=9209 RepID=UPI0031198E89